MPLTMDKTTIINKVPILAVVVVATAAVASAMIVTEFMAAKAQGDGGTGTGCAINSHGFNASKGKCHHTHPVQSHKGTHGTTHTG